MKIVYPACFYPMSGQDRENGYVVSFPDLPGCVTQGFGLAEAIEMAVDAASGWALDEMEDGNIPPKASLVENVKLDKPNGFVNLVVLDMDAYSEKYGSKPVRKNLTIPAWLATIAERERVNYSDVLQSALIEKLHIAH